MIGERIKTLRKERGLSQTELADKIGESKQTIYKYERNITTNIPSDKIEAIAEALTCSPCYLMGWSDELNPQISMPVKLRSDERELLEYYNRLNPDGRDKVFAYIKDCIEIPKYKKDIRLQEKAHG